MLRPTRFTRPLQVLVAACSVVFAVGTTLHNVAVVDVALVETMMRAAGSPDAAAEAPGFTRGLRLVGTLYIVGNAVGVLALWSRSRLLWWWLLAVNLTQGLGFALIPPQMWTAVVERYGPLGVVPSAVTDGGAALLALVMLGTLVAFRATWARRRPQPLDTGPTNSQYSNIGN